MDKRTKASQLHQEARNEMDRGNIARAVELFQESINALPHFKTLELLGECLLKLDRLPEAVVSLAASATLGNNAFRALFLLGTVLEELGERADAIRILDRALSVNPHYRAAREARERMVQKP